MHEIPVTEGKPPPVGMANCCTVQVVPFQPAAEPDPTAVHAVAVGHDTRVTKAPAGMLWSFHAVPL